MAGPSPKEMGEAHEKDVARQAADKASPVHVASEADELRSAIERIAGLAGRGTPAWNACADALGWARQHDLKPHPDYLEPRTTSRRDMPPGAECTISSLSIGVCSRGVKGCTQGHGRETSDAQSETTDGYWCCTRCSSAPGAADAYHLNGMKCGAERASGEVPPEATPGHTCDASGGGYDLHCKGCLAMYWFERGRAERRSEAALSVPLADYQEMQRNFVEADSAARSLAADVARLTNERGSAEAPSGEKALARWLTEAREESERMRNALSDIVVECSGAHGEGPVAMAEALDAVDDIATAAIQGNPYRRRERDQPCDSSASAATTAAAGSASTSEPSTTARSTTPRRGTTDPTASDSMPSSGPAVATAARTNVAASPNACPECGGAIGCVDCRRPTKAGLSSGLARKGYLSVVELDGVEGPRVQVSVRLSEVDARRLAPLMSEGAVIDVTFPDLPFTRSAPEVK